MVNFPEITKAQLYNPFIRNEYDQNTLDWLNEFSSHLFDAIMRFFPKTKESEIKFMNLHLISAVIFPAIFPGIFQEFTGLDIKNSNAQKKYIDCLLSNFKVK